MIVSAPSYRCARYFLAAFLMACQAMGATAQDWIAQVDKSVVRVVVGNEYQPTGTGTGWVVAKGGYIVTNHHVIDGSDRQIVIFRDGDGKAKSFEARIVAQSAPNDLVILKITADPVPLKISSQLPSKGGDVFAIGFPGAADEVFNNYKDEGGAIESTVTSGKIGRVVQGQLFNDDENQGFATTTWIQHSAAISGGNSGGPLFDSCGRVIGVNTAGALGRLQLETGAVEVPQGILLAAPVENVVSLLRQSGAEIVADDETSACGTPAVSGTPSTADTPSSTKGGGVSWPLIGIGSLVAALIAIMAMSARQPAIISETYTQFKRRSQPASQSSGGARKERTSISWVLKGKTSSGALFEFPINNREQITLGRSRELSTHVIDDPTISRQHLAITFNEEGATLRDLGSANGTRVDGHVIGGKPTRAVAGQHLRLGRVDLLIIKKQQNDLG